MRRRASAGADDGRGATDRAPAGRRRRRATAGAALAAMLLGFFLAGLLDAAALRRDAESLPIGARRTALLWLVRPMTALSGAVGLDEAGASPSTELLGATTTSITRAVTSPARTTPRSGRARSRPRKPLRLYIAGDSMAGQFGGPLAAMAEKTGRIRTRVDYHVSSGLSRPDYFDWPQRLIDEVLDSRSEAIVFLVGGNDAQNVEWDGRVLKVGTRAWLDVYHLRVAEAMEVATAGGRRVYWVGQPIMRDRRYGDRMAMLNDVYEKEAALHEGVTYVDTWDLMAGKDGEYAAYLHDPDGGFERMRQADGIHLTRAGGDRIAARVLEVIRDDWDMDGGSP